VTVLAASPAVWVFLLAPLLGNLAYSESTGRAAFGAGCPAPPG
jgi:hypothetical protein